MNELEECQITLKITELLLELRVAGLPDSNNRLARIERLARALRECEFPEEVPNEVAMRLVFGLN